MTINQGSSSVSTAISDSGGGVVSSVLGEKVYDTATVTGTPAAFAPTGNVKYYFSTDGGTTYSLFDTEPVGTQSINTASLPAGSYSFEAQYSGDSNYAASPMSSPEPLTINKATPTVTVTDNGGIYTGSAYPATATATGVAGLPSPSAEGSSVTYTYYLGTYTLSQLAEETPLSPDVAPSAVGNYTVLASFTATTDYNAASNSTNFSITAEDWVDSDWTAATPNPIDHSGISTAVIPANVTLVYGVNAFSTIGGGVAALAADPGGAVDVLPGTSGTPYSELVTLNNPITLEGADLQDPALAMPVVTAPTTASHAVIVSVNAVNVTVNGFNVVVDQPNAGGRHRRRYAVQRLAGPQ